MTVVLTAARFFGGNQRLCLMVRVIHGYLQRPLSPSRLNRRLHAVPEETWRAPFALLAEAHMRCNLEQQYVVHSMPVPVCDNIRICRCRLYPEQQTEGVYRSYIASKRRYFYGLRVHLAVTASGLPVEFALAPARQTDVAALRQLGLPLVRVAFACGSILVCRCGVPG